MVENLHFRSNKPGNHGHHALEGSIEKIVLIVPTNCFNCVHISFQSCQFHAFKIIPIALWILCTMCLSSSNIWIMPWVVSSHTPLNQGSGIVFFIAHTMLVNTQTHTEGPERGDNVVNPIPNQNTISQNFPEFFCQVNQTFCKFFPRNFCSIWFSCPNFKKFR